MLNVKRHLIVFMLLFSYTTLADVEVNKVKNSFKIVDVFETDDEYQTRLNQIEDILLKYDSDPSLPLLYIGKENVSTQSSKKFEGGTLSIGRRNTPSYFDVIYKVNSTNFTDGYYVKINRKTAQHRVYKLDSNDVKPAFSFKMEDRIMSRNISDNNEDNQRLLLTFANRLIERNICVSITSGARYTSASATLFCGDGMSYTQTLAEIKEDKEINLRLVESYAVF